ncbi:DUF177 domain-containing protein [Proteiniclasticum sp. BAD-10]|uniref:DUF177 domain-containing protein n=1 Tax=Proteiniclasticum sediminis TaxID=2804028 RepID=A0A941CMM6_9CLOT|nr:DUF177 domain-containing protein [Proteiniclasticum sediminis]MBR0575461.1 DUF177 domain-containing protein [Proteiniclasticum sediminis]
MEISLQDSIGKSISKDIDFAYHKANLVYNNETIEIVEPIAVRGQVTVSQGIADVKLSVKTRMRYTCSRCLDIFEEDFELEIDEKVSKDEQEDENIITLEEGDVLDLRDVVLNNIYSALPLKVLCKEECKGLCQDCGFNLNHGTCECAHEELDPRFSALKDMF